MGAGALHGLRVLDLTRVLAGPYGTMVLADFGAEVIKVEQPGRGDDTRRWGPPFDGRGESAYFLAVNRNKRSMTLNLKSEAGREVLRDLVRRADVLIENFKVGTMAGLGLGYEDLRVLNEGLIYCAITGYGQDGPYAQRPGYDTVIQAQGGLMSITGPANGEPFKVGVAIVDVTAGLYAAVSILAALQHRQRTGEGQFIDIALFDTQLSWLVNVASSYLLTGDAPGRYGNGHATIVPYQVFESADGYLMVAVGNDGQFGALCRALAREEWAGDARFASNAARVANREPLVSLLQERFATRRTEAWIALLLEAGVPCGPVNDVPAALDDPQSVARGMVQEVGVGDGAEAEGVVRMVGPAPKLSRTPAQVRSAPPRLGEHTEEVLREVLGYDAGLIVALQEAGAL